MRELLLLISGVAILTEASCVFLVNSRLYRLIRAKLSPFDHIILCWNLHLFPFDTKHCIDEFLMLVADQFDIGCQLQVLSFQLIDFCFQEINFLVLLAHLCLKRHHCFPKQSKVSSKCLEGFGVQNGLRRVCDCVELINLRLNVFLLLNNCEWASMVKYRLLLQRVWISPLLTTNVLFVGEVFLEILESLPYFSALLNLLLRGIKLFAQVSSIIGLVVRGIVGIVHLVQSLFGTWLLIVYGLRVSLCQAPARILLSLC
jgi:hypothetical protein